MIDWRQLLFFLSATALILFQVVRGWRLGVVRQVFNLLALGLSYAAVVWRHDVFAPFLGMLGLPDFLNGVASGLILGLGVYGGISAAASILLKRTSHQSLAALRFVYGLGGAFIGLLFGLFLTWIALMGIRLLGTVAETELLAASRHARTAKIEKAGGRKPEVSGLVRGLAGLKQSMDQGQAGVVAEAVDPLPEKVYSTLTKVAMLISDPASIDRFLAYPGAQIITAHPRMVALTEDAKITDDLNNRNYFALLRNPHIVGAANDPELAALVKKFELDKALDHALQPPGGVSATVAKAQD